MLGDANGMFALGRKGAIAGDRCPTIAQHFHVRATQIDHRLDGENHARFQFGASAGIAKVQNVGLVMEKATKAVANKITYNAAAFGFGKALDGVANVTSGVAGFGDGKFNVAGTALLSNANSRARRSNSAVVTPGCANS